jgi:hypothetical protein
MTVLLAEVFGKLFTSFWYCLSYIASSGSIRTHELVTMSQLFYPLSYYRWLVYFSFASIVQSIHFGKFSFFSSGIT